MKRIVIGANAHVELAAALAAARPDLEVRGNRYTEITSDDLAWGEVYVGFRRPPAAESMGNIQWVHCTGAGVDSWLYPEALPTEILLTRSSESFGAPIAEWALARALAFTQQLPSLHEAQRARRWAPRDTVLLASLKVLVVGTGDVGTHVGRLFRALGCDVCGVSRTGGSDPSVFTTHAAVDALPTLVPDAQIVVITVPLTHNTRGLFSRELLALCRGVTLINAGRGAVVDESALPDALERGWLSGAALDVFEVEPLPESSPLWSHPRVIVSPHISGLTTTHGAIDGFLECLAAIDRGELPRWRVDRERGY